MNTHLKCLFCFCLVLAAPLQAQMQPASSRVIHYFPQLADGGPPEQRWQTTLTFTNALTFPSTTAYVTIRFRDDNGQPLALDFGGGPRSEFDFSIPPGGSRIFRSRMASPNTVTGWAVALASYPVQGTVSFRAYVSGRAAVEISAHGTAPTYNYHSPANTRLGVAVVNAYDSPLTVLLRVWDQDGRELGQKAISLAARGHTAFNLWQHFPQLPESFSGSIALTAAGKSVVAWSMGADEVFYSLPSGEYGWPYYQWERMWRLFLKLQTAAMQVQPGADIQFEITEEAVVNAWGSRDGIRIPFATAEFMGDADGELAFVIAHELGHVLQFRAGLTPSERDADFFGTFLLLAAGYDPYAGLGALGRLQAAAGSPGLLGEIVRQYTDEHGAFSTRIADILNAIQTTCAKPEYAELCATYKSLMHAHLPPSLPLREPRGKDD